MILMMAGALAGAGLQTGAAPNIADFHKQVAESATHRTGQFHERGLPPIAELAAQRREIRRVLLPIWMPGRSPALQFERRRDLSVTLTIAMPGRPVQQHTVAAGIWRELERHGEAFRAPRPEDPRRPRPANVVSCHGTRAMFEAAGQRRHDGISPSQCAGSLADYRPAHHRAAQVMVRAALATQPGCAADERQPDMALWRCFNRERERG